MFSFSFSQSLECSASSGVVSGEDHHGNMVNASEGNLERMQSAGSICHPSTTTRFCESTETDSNHAHLSHESSLENQNDMMEHSPEQITSPPTPGAQRPSNNSSGTSIKLEPVSPVRGVPSGSSLSEDGEHENNEIIIDDSDGIQIIQSDSPIPGSSTAAAGDKSVETSTGAHPWRQNSLTPSESGGRGILRRQATVDLPDCENDQDELRSTSNEMSVQQDSPKVGNQGNEERTSRRETPDGHLKPHHGEHSTNKEKNLQQQSSIPQPEVSHPSSLRELVSHGRDGNSLGQERCALETSRSMEVNSEPQPISRSVRVRSHSISEGEISQNPEGRPLVKEYPHQATPAVSGAPRVPSIHVSQQLPVPSYFAHGYHGLVYQPRSWDGDASGMYRSLAPPGHPNHPDYRGPVRSRSEEVPSIVPSNAPPSGEESVLYKYLQTSGKPKRNLGRPTLSGSSHSADTDMNHPGYYMPGMGDIRRQLHHPMMISWSPANSSLQSHGSFGLYQEQSPSPNSQPAGSGQPSPENYRFHRGLDLRSAESNQDLAHVDDITRQVQRAVGSASSLYGPSEHPMITHNNNGSPQHCSREEDEIVTKDADGAEVKKRSRKSTFNIYREIPERKRKLDRDEEERIKHSYNPDGSFDYFSLTGWKAYKCALCKKRRFKTASELEEHKQSKHPNEGDLLRHQSPVPQPGSGPSMVQERAFSPATNG